MRTFSAIIIIAALLMGGCGKDQTSVETSQPIVSETQASRPVPYVRLPEGEHPQDWEDIRVALEDALVRMAYDDKTGLWENEFPYLHERETIDKYLKRGEITWANVDSLIGVEILSITISADTASLLTDFVLLSPDGSSQKSPMPMEMFKYNGGWRKPYVSDLLHQREYDEWVRQSIKDSQEDW
ncbi:MAG TPA: hypothetical protein PLF13_02610 [candidate division Zixibacteria bacterium]|nr:hypothetical protein [candidate division Zixibacteria bacterium]